MIEADPLTATWKVARELNVDHSVVIRHLKQVGKVKKFDKWVPHELTANQKKCCFEASSSLILCNKDKPFLNWIVTCNAKWTLYDKRLSVWTKKTLQSPSQSQIYKKKMIMITVWWSSAGLMHYSFLNPRETLTPWEVCSANQQDSLKTAMPAAGTGQQNGPHSSPGQHLTTHSTTNTSKVEWIGLQSFASSAIFTWPLKTTASSSILTTFCRENTYTTSRMLSKSLLNPKHRFLHYRNK